MTFENKSDSEAEWKFEFVLEREGGEPIDQGVASDLLEWIAERAEVHGCQIGGGYSERDQFTGL